MKKEICLQVPTLQVITQTDQTEWLSEDIIGSSDTIEDFKSQTLVFPESTDSTHTHTAETEMADPRFSGPAVWRESLQEVGYPFTQSHNQSAWVHSPDLLKKKGGGKPPASCQEFLLHQPDCRPAG